MTGREWRWRSTSMLAASLSTSSPAGLNTAHVEALMVELRTLLPALPAAAHDGQDNLIASCVAALRVVDRNLLAGLQEAADAALASLDLLEASRDGQELSLALKLTGKKMVLFLKAVLHR
jgi:hypothetical protein